MRPIPPPPRARTSVRTLILSSIASLLAVSAMAVTLPTGFTETLVASGLSSPTAMAFAPDGRLFVCQQGGQLRVIKNGSLLATPFVTVTVSSAGERGLLGVTFDPDFANNHFVYVYYTATTPAIHNRVSRFTANGDVALAGSETILLELNNLSGATNHNGGALHFGPDGKLYIAVGENATPSSSTMWGRTPGRRSTTASRARTTAGPTPRARHRTPPTAGPSSPMGMAAATRRAAPSRGAPSTTR